MSPNRLLSPIFSLLLAAPVALAKVETSNKISTGGVVIEYPRGRFQENSAPNFFKWNVVGQPKTITLKVYKTQPQGGFDPVNDLIARYDMMPETDSMTWQKDSLPVGNYAWFVESYGDQDSSPLHVDSARFSVEKIQQIDLRVKRASVNVGFARGTSKSVDPNYTIVYDTTPTLYGLYLGGGKDNTIWDLDGFMGDFIFRGSVQRTYSLTGAYLWSLNNQTQTTEYFLGPTLRVAKFVRVRTDNGVDIGTEGAITVNPGFRFGLQKHIHLHYTLYSQLAADLNVGGSKTAVASLDNLSWGVKTGLISSLFWPLGFAGEFRYNVLTAATKYNADTIKVTQTEWGVTGSLIYIF